MEFPCADSMAADPLLSDRARLSGLIQRFLNGDITAFQFDEALDEFRGSNDSVIAFTVDALWYFYDDCDDHHVALPKWQWDYIQRLLLLLASNCTVHTQSKWCWSWTQLAAAVCLALFVVLAIQVGWGAHLLIASIPFGMASIALSKVPRATPFSADPLTHIIHPFATFADLRTAYEAVQFQKARYPRDIGDRRIRSEFSDRLNSVELHAGWLVLAPLPLLFQMFPHKATLTVATAK